MKTRILQSAQRLIQERGVNGFSYADIAKELEVSKPSLHHHFASKGILVSSLMEQYTQQLVDYLHQFANEKPLKRVEAYCDVYRQSLNQQRVCMGGILSAEALTLTSDMQPLLKEFFGFQKRWLADLLEEGKANGDFQFSVSSEKEANLIVTALQGGLIVARAMESPESFEQNVESIIRSLSA